MPRPKKTATTTGKGTKARKRAATKTDGFRMDAKVPLIRDTTELITPEKAQEMLKKNPKNRPVAFGKVKQYQKLMEKGEWVFHPQGIILDNKGNLLTGQKRLWAVALSGKAQYFRVSRGCPAEAAHLLDRGTSQSNRDLATRKTGRKHSPVEASIARAWLVLEGNVKPTIDEVSEAIVLHDEILDKIMGDTRGIKKNNSMKMILAAIIKHDAIYLLGRVEFLGKKLEEELAPITIKEVWNRGAAFTLGMDKADGIVEAACLRKKRSN